MSANQISKNQPLSSVQKARENAAASWSAALCAAFDRTKILLTIIAVLASTGCSSFHKEWKAASTSSTPVRGIEGRWIGEWRSEKNNHHGELKAVITQTSPTTYRAHYRAKYLKILHFSYVATLNGSETNNVVTLEGQANLGKLAGGIYTYKSTATPTEFRSTYECKYDHGHYEMSRPQN